jgi:hypothetical protein
MLRTETNTPEMEARIDQVFLDRGPAPCSRHGQLDFEHGQWWVTCSRCGAQWSVCDAEPGEFYFEQVTDGDGYCGDV